MIILEFGTAEKQCVTKNSMFIKFPWGSPTFKRDVEKLQNFWNRVYDKENHEWEVPYTDEILAEIQTLFDNDIQYRNERPKQVNTEKMNNYLNSFDWGTFKPYPYQIEGIKYGLTRRNWILGDTMGLGKSFQTIQLANIYKNRGRIKHCLVVCCVNSLKYNWLNEIQKFTKESAVILGTRPGKTEMTKEKLYDISVSETKEQIKNKPEEFFWIINIEKLRASKEEKKLNNTIVDALNTHIKNGDLGMVIIDEIHMCRNPKASQSEMLMDLDNEAIKVGMSGTLVVNDPLNLYVPMKVVGLISSNYYKFSERYLLKNQFGGVYGFQNVKELQSILYNSFIRRTKEEVAKDLPPVVFKNEILEFSSDEEKVFNEITGKIKMALQGKDFENTLIDLIPREKLLDKIDAPSTLMSMITRFRQCTTHTGLLSSKIQKSTKFERLKDILDEAIINGEKVLVFCQFTQAIDIAKEYFKEYKPKIIVGGMGNKIMDIVNEHENTEGFSVIFAQTQTLGVGHSLPNTSQVVFLSLLWDYATFEQCFNRCHRVTSKKKVTVTNLIMKDTYDETIYDKIYAKKAMGDVIVDKVELNACIDYIKKLGIDFKIDKAIESNTLITDEVMKSY